MLVWGALILSASHYDDQSGDETVSALHRISAVHSGVLGFFQHLLLLDTAGVAQVGQLGASQR